jgi:hypothetical protein
MKPVDSICFLFYRDIFIDMKLIQIIRNIILENDEEGGSIEVDKKMTEKTLNDVFVLTDRGLEYVKTQLEKLDKKARRIGVQPLELQIVSERFVKRDDNMRGQVLVKVYTVKIEGKSPVIDGYEFIANIEHSPAGNIINVSPNASVKELPAEYRNSNTDCDYCHTKRDRLNTFVLMKTDTKEFKKVGRSCLKNFLPSQNPQTILEYAAILSRILNSLVGGEDMDYDDRDARGGGGWEKYYDAAEYMKFVCLAYYINGERFISGKVAREHEGMVSTGNFALALMNFDREDNEFKQKYTNAYKSNMQKADALAKKIEEWKDIKDWDAEMEKNPDMATYFHNLKVISNSDVVQYKNAGYHASLLGVYLREKEWSDKQAVAKEKAKTKSYIGKVGEKISFVGKLKKYTTWPSNWGEVYMYVFLEDNTENEVVYFSSRDLGIEEGKRYRVKATVKKQELSKYTQTPQTIITRGKVEPVEGELVPAPAATEVPVTPAAQ